MTGSNYHKFKYNSLSEVFEDFQKAERARKESKAAKNKSRGGGPVETEADLDDIEKNITKKQSTSCVTINKLLFFLFCYLVFSVRGFFFSIYTNNRTLAMTHFICII